MMEKFSDVLIVVGISDMLKNKGSKFNTSFYFYFLFLIKHY